METEFWGVQVKSGETLKVSPGYGKVLHLSQASLGNNKHDKGKESVCLFVNVDGEKLVLGTLITNKVPQHLFDLLFDREFELFHDWESGSVYFYGYKASNSSGEDESLEGASDGSESEPEENIHLNVATNGKRKSNATQENPSSKVGQKRSETSHQEKPEANAEQHKDMVAKENGEDNEVEASKKRPVESATDTLDPNKKAKVTSQEIGSNTEEPLANNAAPVLYTCSISREPLPENNAVIPAKNPADILNNQKLKPYTCKICMKRFGTLQGVEAHTKAKHEIQLS